LRIGSNYQDGEDATVLSRLHYPQRISQTQKQKEPGTRTTVLQIIYDVKFI